MLTRAGEGAARRCAFGSGEHARTGATRRHAHVSR